MKKYRLKKWYPSLHKDWVVGDIVIPWEKQKDYYHVPNKSTTIFKREVENNPDFWELIEQKEPLFITDDGVDIFDLCQTVYLIHPKTFIKQKSDLGYFSTNVLDNNKLFYHESNADEYIWRNKKVFSYEDFIRWGNVPYERVIEQLAKERGDNEF